MVQTVVPFTVKAVLYYQGESDLTNSDLYEEAFKTLVKSWRRVFEDPGLPFFVVQIPGYDYPNQPEMAARVREAQRKCMNSLNGVYLSSAVDLGQENDLHPKEKNVLSERLAKVILEKIYRRGKNNMSPSFYSYQCSDHQMVLFTEFNNLNLVSHSNRFLGFKVSYDGETFVDAHDVTLSNNQIIIFFSRKIKEIRYAFQNYPHCDIYTTNDLPLLPFRIVIE
jgi:sialate O-acetylesterase